MLIGQFGEMYNFCKENGYSFTVWPFWYKLNVSKIEILGSNSSKFFYYFKSIYDDLC